MKLVTDGQGIVQELTILRPSNFHAHFRRGAMMDAVTRHILRYVRYALVMPNTGPIRTLEELIDYHADLQALTVLGVDHPVDFVMTLYFTDLITPAVIHRIKEIEERLGIRIAIKWYPPEPGATTGSGHGLPLRLCDESLREMELLQVPFLGHIEAMFDKHGHLLPEEEREGYMIENTMWRFRDTYPRLLHSIEHASTIQAVKYVDADPSGNTVMTVTPQHSLFVGDDFHALGTELKCKPVVKSPEHRDAVAGFATTGDPRAISGNDTAPHAHKTKMLPFAEASNGCWLPHEIELYAEVFDRARALGDPFERFMSINGPTWWNLPLPSRNDTIRIIRKEGAVPPPIPIPGSDDTIVPLGWGEDGSKIKLSFQIVA